MLDQAPVQVTRESTEVAESPQVIYRVEQALYLVFGVINMLIALRFVLKLLGANPGSPFVSFIYNVTAGLVAPFAGIFSPIQSGSGVFEPMDLLAILIWALVGWLLVRIAWLLIGNSSLGSTTTSWVTRSRFPW